MKPSGMSGHAVMEGVLIKQGTEYAVAVRRADQTIEVKKGTFFRIFKYLPFLELPFLRGIADLMENCYLGLITFLSSVFFFGEEEVRRKEEWEDWISTGTGMRFTGDGKRKKRSRVQKGIYAFFRKAGMFFLMLCMLVIVLTLFLAVPAMLAEQFAGMGVSIEKKVWEIGFRLLIAAALLVCLSRTEEVKRLYRYHGAAHKAINCAEAGLGLTPENAGSQPVERKRCGTGFFFLVLTGTVFFPALDGKETLWLPVLFWILLVLVSAAVSYEVLLFTEKSAGPLAGFICQPGIWCQKLMIKEPEDDMLEAAVQAVKAVQGQAAGTEEKSSAEAAEEAAAGRETEERPLSAVTKERLRRTLFNDEYSIRQNVENTGMDTAPPEQDQEEDAILRALDRYFGE